MILLLLLFAGRLLLNGRLSAGCDEGMMRTDDGDDEMTSVSRSMRTSKKILRGIIDGNRFLSNNNNISVFWE